MNSSHMKSEENTSTPKRRRLGTGRLIRGNLKINNKDNSALLTNYSPIHRQVSNTLLNSLNRCESPPLPSNQDEYLYDSRNSDSASRIPISPITIDSSTPTESNWKSLNVFECMSSSEMSAEKIKNEIEDISDDMFHSRLEQESRDVEKCSGDISNNHNSPSSELKHGVSFISGNALLDLKIENENNHDDNMFSNDCVKRLKNDIDESFQMINQSICEINDEDICKCDKSALFETKDSFLLDIKESGLVKNHKEKNECDSINFYGLPMVTKSLFQSYRNIDKFYDWQEECLNLPAIKQRRNLIYALPTSGGKTLVAEVLMLREVINRKKNALFILPFVAIVQEKKWALSPFALKLDFLVEDYAGGNGHIPPKKRRKKNSIYVATIEKGLALVRSLVELDRLNEIGLIVVDELHLIGEQGRGSTLEILLTTALFAGKDIQIVGMSATIGNLSELAQFLRAEVFQREFRPVQLTEYVKLGNTLQQLHTGPDGLSLEIVRQLSYDYSPAALCLDPDFLGGLVSEVVPEGSCLVFCPTKRNCENVAALLCKLQRREMWAHRWREREVLCASLRAEGAGAALCKSAKVGVAFHHAGLAAEERALLEQAFRSGVVSVLCCTSTLAAGVNLPARRVIVRAPARGREPLSLAHYRQMAGRAGRAGVCDHGESIIMCSQSDWPRLKTVLSGSLEAARSRLAPVTPALILSAAALKLASTPADLRRFLNCTLLAINPEVDIREVCNEGIKSLLNTGALEIKGEKKKKPPSGEEEVCFIEENSQLVVSKLGVAAIKGCMDLSTAKQFLDELNVASRSLVLIDSLHLLFLVTPHDGAGIKPDYRHYYSLYDSLDEEGVQTARVLGITEMNAIRMMTGKPITNIPEQVLSRFYLSLMLRDLWRQMPFPAVAEKYNLPRGTVQSVLSGAASFSCSAQRVSEELGVLWFPALLGELADSLRHCAHPGLHHLMELPTVRKARAMQLMRAGFKRIEDVAKAAPEQLTSAVEHLSRTAATHLIGAARMMLIEKVENLRAEAEDVMDELKL